MDTATHTRDIKKILKQYNIISESLTLDLTIYVLQAEKAQLDSDYKTFKEVVG